MELKVKSVKIPTKNRLDVLVYCCWFSRDVLIVAEDFEWWVTTFNEETQDKICDYPDTYIHCIYKYLKQDDIVYCARQAPCIFKTLQSISR